MIPAEQLDKLNSMISKAKQDLQDHIKSFELYKNEVRQEKLELALKLRSFDKDL